jgi:hypothetical protein
VNDSDCNHTRRREENDGNPEVEVASASRARFLFESLLVQEVFRGGVPGLLDNCYGLTPFSARTLDQRCHA